VARRLFRPYEERVEFVYLSGLSMDDLVRRVANLPNQSIVQYLHIFQDGAGKTFIPAEALKILAARVNAPIYGHVGSYIGYGAVGGRAVSFELEGQHAARLGLRILAGERPETLKVQEVSPNAYLFDGRQLRRWGLAEATLPPGSKVLYREPGLWDLYRWQIVGAVALLVLQTALIGALLAERASRRRADLGFWQVTETAPYGMVMVGRDGCIAMANAQTEQLFGYRKEELIGQPVEVLVPERFRSRHIGHRERFSSSPEVRPMGAGQELFGRRKDGSEFPVEIALSPARPSMRRFVLATIVDMSLRRQAEESLRLSQIELRRLTGRLLLAQEDESRRIARELHDDLGQRLALLSVELEFLRQRSPESPDQLGTRMQELVGHVKQVSSSVHALSHRLHPSKLDQLGLVASLGGLCQELTQGHGLKIEFVDHQMPPTIPSDVAVCLYRIAQEALSNAIKHGGAHHVEVDLGGSATAIALRIVDDGVGFDARLVQHAKGLGLISMRERVLHLGGEITIDSRPGGGTELLARIPLGSNPGRP
jgi:PAS domain S-box-containing protein